MKVEIGKHSSSTTIPRSKSVIAKLIGKNFIELQQSKLVLKSKLQALVFLKMKDSVF